MPRRILAAIAAVYLIVSGPAPAAADSVNARLDRMYKLINEIRKKHNLGPLNANPKLSLAAANHSKDIAEHDLFGHRGSDGSRLEDRLKRVGYNYKLAAENVAGGHESPEKTVDSWMNSTGHRRNMLDPNMCRIGLGYAFLKNDGGAHTYHHYWTIVLVRPPGVFCPVN